MCYIGARIRTALVVYGIYIYIILLYYIINDIVIWDRS